MRPAHFRTLVVGGGPAGLAPLVAASRDGRLDDLLAGGLAVVERSAVFGTGRLGSYAISSDSTAETFLTAVTDHIDPRLEHLLETPLCQALKQVGRGAVPLSTAASLMAAIGSVLASAIVQSGGAIYAGYEALEARQNQDGTWTLTLRRLSDGIECEISADVMLLATGGHQSLDRLRSERVAGRPLLPVFRDKLILSDEALQPQGVAAIRQRLAAHASPKIAIVGGSTSALAAAGLLLRECTAATAEPGSITILHRRPVRVFYPSAELARADAYDDFGPDDICPLSGFVFRLAGLRLDSRELMMGMLQLGGRVPEPRVMLHRIDEEDHARTQNLLESADLVIAALGYRPRALPLKDYEGRPVALRGHAEREPLVDERCRVCSADGRPIPNLFGIGLAAGFVPRGTLGGEPSFVGQANGLWLWQTAVGSMIVDGVMAAHARPLASLSILAAAEHGSMAATLADSLSLE